LLPAPRVTPKSKRFVENSRPEALIKIESPCHGGFCGFEISELTVVAREHEVKNPSPFTRGSAFSSVAFASTIPFECLIASAVAR
jgi:hypothetical protein